MRRGDLYLVRNVVRPDAAAVGTGTKLLSSSRIEHTQLQDGYVGQLADFGPVLEVMAGENSHVRTNVKCTAVIRVNEDGINWSIGQLQTNLPPMKALIRGLRHIA